MSYPHYVFAQPDGLAHCACGYTAPITGPMLGSIGREVGADCPIATRETADLADRTARQLAEACQQLAAAPGLERAKIVAWLRSLDEDEPLDSAVLARAIEAHADERE